MEKQGVVKPGVTPEGCCGGHCKQSNPDTNPDIVSTSDQIEKLDDDLTKRASETARKTLR